MNPWFATAVAALYAGAIFWVAWRVDRRPEPVNPGRWLPIYALSLAVYCTSWTYFGAVGTAAREGWTFLPIYLGPILMFLFGAGFMSRLAEAVRRENAVSIADFISARFGKSRSLAALVTATALFGALPYVALQLKSIGMSFAELVGGVPGSAHQGVENQAMLVASVALTVFIIIFGARRYDVTGRNRGLVAAMAVESAVKLAALAAIGALALVMLRAAPAEARTLGADRMAALFAVENLSISTLTVLALSMAAIVCLPRQFYITFIEARAPDYIRKARPLFIAYLVAVAGLVFPITWAGLTVLPASTNADLYVLDLPLAAGSDVMALAAFLGGFAAATGMVVVATVALATMISNDLAAPLLLRSRAVTAGADMGRLLLWVRRGAITLVMVLAYSYAVAVDRAETLASIGLVAFAAMAQFAPALWRAVYGPSEGPAAVRAGLAVGFGVWAYTLLLPAYFGPDGLELSGLTQAFGGLIHPQALFDISWPDPLTHGVVVSLGLNLLTTVLVRASGQGANLGVRLKETLYPDQVEGRFGTVATMRDLQHLTERFVGSHSAQLAFSGYAAARGRPLNPTEPVDKGGARLAERLIAGVIGAPSARVILGSALSGASLDVGRVVQLLDGTREELQFSRELLSTTLNAISQGVSVVDKDLRLVAWNSRYVEMFQYPPDLIRVGRPIADVIRFNAQRGECGPGEVEEHVHKRLAHMRRGAVHVNERQRPGGGTLKTLGNPMPGGGYVTTFTDISAEKAAQAALQDANDQLEQRVRDRTTALEDANHELAREAAVVKALADALHRAKLAADAANASKTKFLAAASHDLLQPLHAARLFTSALADHTAQDPLASTLAGKVDQAIASADQLLRALLDVSKLDAGGVRVHEETLPLAQILSPLGSEFAALAADKGLKFRLLPSTLLVHTDRTLLRQIVQNLLANAVRYTTSGGVLVGCRQRGDRVRIEVHDTGPGIPADKQDLIFEEFQRLGGHSDGGVGLGLAIVQRAARLIGAKVSLSSVVGRGSSFFVELPAAPAPAGIQDPEAIPPSEAVVGQTGRLEGMRVLCVDNDPTILEAISASLRGWGAVPTVADGYGAAVTALDHHRFDAALIDYHLGGEETGLDVLARWRALYRDAPALVITAEPPQALAAAVSDLGAEIAKKPVNPQRLRTQLAKRWAQRGRSAGGD